MRNKVKRLQEKNILDSNTVVMVICESAICIPNKNDFYLLDDKSTIRKDMKDKKDPIFIKVVDEDSSFIGKFRIIESSNQCAVWGKEQN